ncbi:hypothetical protein ACFP63_08760 [Oerskovia jenensis]|uniref:Transcriptional regulator n=1 Tax=Oerskovia jenensis TaxID=162169 RepID=A0ABS2LI99_9CELL|nr:hypothetical protein [Oerskovia jenensis]MBM7480143.1 hypothetical protein [Oerskovia jenensis]
MIAPDYVAQVAELLGQHRIECTGMEGVTCRACREHGWMPMRTFAAHLSEVLAAAGLLPTRTEWGVRGQRGHTIETLNGRRMDEEDARDLAGGVGTVVSRAVTDWKDA